MESQVSDHQSVQERWIHNFSENTSLCKILAGVAAHVTNLVKIFKSQVNFPVFPGFSQGGVLLLQRQKMLSFREPSVCTHTAADKHPYLLAQMLP